MTGIAAGVVVALIGLLVLVLAGPVIGGTPALVIGLGLIAAGVVVALMSRDGRSL